ncbi:N-methylhydantoinase A [hydrothermal vent metagenome]|uniref:N-methylhydantoinase A n=1 Tax=hydrothermal vent metagenome TaxID=652676 RepID=A0A3B1AII5_9ZZZZ
MLLGIDTGGTFTDFVLFKNGLLKIHKVLSTPKFPEQAILRGITELGILDSQALDDFTIIHGSTVATNAVLERKGARTVYVANNGLADLLTIARQTRPELYTLQGPIVKPPVEKELCLEANTRVTATGEVIQSMSEHECQQLCQKIIELKPESVAINFLFSYLNSNDEKKLFDKLPKSLFVSQSSVVLPELKEYERGISTWLNSYVGPLVQGYIQRLQSKLPRVSISVMQSSGGTISASQAGEQAVRMLLSGPAGGMAGAKYMSDIVKCSKILTFDMGGTSTDVAMIDNDIQLTNEGCIGSFPVAVPMVDMHTIGAGGGSIAVIDSGGVLQVGPESAGAEPGPACYGRGGNFATVTDANVVLGRIPSDEFLGGTMTLDDSASKKVISQLAKELSLDIFETALGIIQIANEHMAQALRVMSVQRGLDPRLMSLVSFGGAGSLHVCALADSLSINRALVPIHGGVLSAFGMLVAPKARYLSHSFLFLATEVNYIELYNGFTTLRDKGIVALQQEYVATEDIQLIHELDLRYVGQSSFITVPINFLAIGKSKDKTNIDLTQYINVFHQQHLKRYGHQINLDVEIVNIRLTLKSDSASPKISTAILKNKHNNTIKKHRLYGFDHEINSYHRDNLLLGDKISGPALIVEKTSTTFIEATWCAEVMAMGNIVLTKSETK